MRKVVLFGTNRGGVSPPSQLLLDEYPNAAAAYSLRELSTASVGSAVVRVRRSSDNAEQDFTATEITDGTLTTFTGANDGFVTTWYDQSGGGNDATQTSATSQPQLVSSGVVVLNNGKPSALFNSDILFSDYFLTPNINNGLQIFSVYQHISQLGGLYDIDFAYSIGRGAANTNRLMDFHTQGSSGNPTNYVVQTQGNSSILDSAFTNSQKLFISLHKSQNNNFYLNGSLANSNTNTLLQFTNTPFRICLGNFEASAIAPSNIFLQELILYPSDQSANRVEIQNNINTEYTIY